MHIYTEAGNIEKQCMHILILYVHIILVHVAVAVLLVMLKLVPAKFAGTPIGEI